MASAYGMLRHVSHSSELTTSNLLTQSCAKIREPLFSYQKNFVSLNDRFEEYKPRTGRLYYAGDEKLNREMITLPHT